MLMQQYLVGVNDIRGDGKFSCSRNKFYVGSILDFLHEVFFYEILKDFFADIACGAWSDMKCTLNFHVAV